MRIEVIICPNCRHKLSIPDELMGTPVQCPQCAAQFVGPPPLPVAPATATRRDEPNPERPAAGPYFGASDEISPPVQEPREGALGPWATSAGLALMGVSFLGLIGAGIRFFRAFSPDYVRQVQQMQRNFGGAAFDDDTVRMVSIVIQFAFCAISVAGMAGGLAIARRTSFAVALIGSCAAMINLENCCCLLGIPVGIACLFIIFQPQIRASFKS